MKGFLDYKPGDSVLHRLDPLTKIFLSVCICAACFLGENPAFLVFLIGCDLLLGALGGVFDRAAGMLKGLLKLSVFLFVLQLLFVRTGAPLLSLPPLLVTDRGVMTGLRLVLRLIGATMPLALLLSVTQMSDLSGVLVQRLHVPYKYAFTLTTAIRFIPVFADSLSGIMEAQTARGVAFDTKNPFKKPDPPAVHAAADFLGRPHPRYRRGRRDARLHAADAGEPEPSLYIQKRRSFRRADRRRARCSGRAALKPERT